MENITRNGKNIEKNLLQTWGDIAFQNTELATL